MELRNLDYSAFNAWFGAWGVVDDAEAQAIAVRRFRPDLKVAFDAWIAEGSVHEPRCRRRPDVHAGVHAALKSRRDKEARRLPASEKFAEGSEAGETATSTCCVERLILATGPVPRRHQRTLPRRRGSRYGLVGVGVIVLTISVITLLTLPGLP